MQKHRLFVVHCAVNMRSLGGEHVFTGQWTCVHWAVNDKKSVEKDWDDAE